MKLQGRDEKGAWLIFVVYLRERRREAWEAIEREIEKQPEGRIMIGGDFNARVGQEQGASLRQEGGQTRKSRDCVINAQGREMLSWLKELGLKIMNGEMEGDPDGDFTFIEGARSVMDYAVTNIEEWENTHTFKIGDTTYSDHMPIEITSLGVEREKEAREEMRERTVWDEAA